MPKKLQHSEAIVYAVAYTCTDLGISLFSDFKQTIFANILTFKMRTKQWSREVKQAAIELW